jgi:heptosyltransferase-2
VVNLNWPKEIPKNVIVRMPNWVGDLVMATPILADLRLKYPKATITAMCQSNVAVLLKEDPNIDEIYSFKRPSGWIHSHSHTEIIDYLHQGDYDLGVLLTNSFSSAWLFWKANVKNRIGYADHMRSLLLNKAVKVPTNKESQHLVITYKELLAPLGIPISDNPPRLYISEEEDKAAKEHLKLLKISDKEIVIGINPGAAYGSAKCWLPDRFCMLTQRLIQSNPHVRVLYFGDNAGAPLVHQICKDLPESVTNLAGKTTLRELMALIQNCSVFLTNDSGPMHIAAALNTKLVALFGSTSSIKTGPYPQGVVVQKDVACAPCFKRVCPIDFRCMTKIEVDDVYNEIQKLI